MKKLLAMILAVCLTLCAIPAASAAAPDFRYYRAGLDPTRQAIYDRLYEFYKTGPEKVMPQAAPQDREQDPQYAKYMVSLEGIEGLTKTWPGLGRDEANRQAGKWEEEIFVPAYRAMLFDHPELTWMERVGHVLPARGGRKGETKDGVYQTTLTHLYAYVNTERSKEDQDLTNTGTSQEIEELIVSSARKVADELRKLPGVTVTEKDGSFTVAGTDRYTVVKAIHDLIANNTSYMWESKTRADETVYNVLKNGRGLCVGYASSVQVLCARYGIPAIQLNGDVYDARAYDANGARVGQPMDAHCWNAVQMEDGKWYALDANYDNLNFTYNGDPYTYLLVGTDTVVWQGMTYSQSHVENFEYVDRNFGVLKTPELSKARYVPAGGTAQTPATPASSVSFTDVRENSPYAQAIAWAVEQNITKGTSATTFGPDNTCTHNHILTFIWRANGSPAAEGGTDFERAVAWAKASGMADEVPPGDGCTRAQAMVYLWKLAESPTPGKAAAFDDVDTAAPYAEAVAWAVEQGITKGSSATIFGPDNICTRGQIVTFLYRSLVK